MIKGKDFKFTKLGSAIQTILFDFLHLNVGDKIPTVDEYTVNKQISRGTYFNALAILEKNKLVILEKKGQTGTIVEKINYLKIWSYLGANNITIAMGYPENDSLKILATILNKIENKPLFNTYLIFSRGSNNRSELLKNGIVDIIVQSQLATEISMQRNNNFGIIFKLDKEYHNENVQVFIKRGESKKIKNQKFIRILYDKNSHDIDYLSQELFKDKDVILVEHAYTQSFDLLKNGIVDVIIHSAISEERMFLFDAEVFMFRDEYSQKLLEKASTISFVYHKQDPSIEKVAAIIMNELQTKEQLKKFKVEEELLNY